MQVGGDPPTSLAIAGLVVGTVGVLGVEEYPDLEAVQNMLALLVQLNWFRYGLDDAARYSDVSRRSGH
ncbi:MAG: hypothetical protein U0521_02720 [Anaerolineae bacterium]